MMNTGMKLLSIVILLGLAAIVPAQQRKPHLASNSARILKGKPTVYLTFVRYGKRESFHINESDEGVWLRVHNNTRWPLVFAGFGRFTRNDEEVTVFYGVEEVPKPRGPFVSPSLPVLPFPYEPPPSQTPASEPPKVENDKDCEVPSGDWGIDVVSPVRLPPGKSLIFSVPRETLCKNLMIYIVYNYSWEKQSEYNTFGDEPEHRVYFHGSDLPKIAR